jgi:hypothetical protein
MTLSSQAAPLIPVSNNDWDALPFAESWRSSSSDEGPLLFGKIDDQPWIRRT